MTERAHDTAPGYIFVAPRGGEAGQGGTMILDNRGEAVWFHPVNNKKEFAMNFRAQQYRGRPVLTWHQHVIGGEEGYKILDTSYREIARVQAGNSRRGDHHDFLITPQDTALITIYSSARRDLSPFGGPKDAMVTEGVLQELDIETGEVLLEWHSLDHVPVGETYTRLDQKNRPRFDYFHINSIDVDRDDNLLISARQTSAVYKIDRKSGEIIWRLNGKKSDFEMGPGTRFAYQHDARRQPDGTITIFDNGTTVTKGGERPKTVEESRGIMLELDEEKMAASLVREYTHPEPQFANAGGNVQVLPDGNVFIGWDPATEDFSEFSKDGELLFSAEFYPRDKSYRAFRFPWSGSPDDQPAAAAERTSEDEVEVYVGWNGATEVAAWEVLAGPNPDQLKPVESTPRDGFETVITVRTAEPYVSVHAKDDSGEVLGTTKPVEL
ncbi:MAG: arylsulfotransferase family protein [Rubrobacter sp.]|nr:arylsulfotransferase family protein [Rubrobacter sp.]